MRLSKFNLFQLRAIRNEDSVANSPDKVVPAIADLTDYLDYLEELMEEKGKDVDIVDVARQTLSNFIDSIQDIHERSQE